MSDAIDAAQALATSAERIAGEACAFDDPNTNPIVLERRDAALRAADAVKEQAIAAAHAAEAAGSGHVDVVA